MHRIKLRPSRNRPADVEAAYQQGLAEARTEGANKESMLRAVMQRMREKYDELDESLAKNTEYTKAITVANKKLKEEQHALKTEQDRLYRELRRMTEQSHLLAQDNANLRRVLKEDPTKADLEESATHVSVEPREELVVRSDGSCYTLGIFAPDLGDEVFTKLLQQAKIRDMGVPYSHLSAPLKDLISDNIERGEPQTCQNAELDSVPYTYHTVTRQTLKE